MFPTVYALLVTSVGDQIEKIKTNIFLLQFEKRSDSVAYSFSNQKYFGHMVIGRQLRQAIGFAMTKSELKMKARK